MRWIKWIFYGFLLLVFIIPNPIKMPVEGATKNDFHPDSFWFYPWGKSVTHKGIDIFATKDTKIYSATKGLVIYTGWIKMGGHVVLVLSPGWQLHYYAHLNEIKTSEFSWVNHNIQIGSVGDSGNAKGKPPHLHYSILSLVPYPWRIDNSTQGWKKMFFLNPSKHFR